MNKNFEALQKAEEKNAELKEKAAEIEKKLQSCVKEYIQLAAEYGITLETSDFNPAGQLVNEEDLEKISGGLEVSTNKWMPSSSSVFYL